MDAEVGKQSTSGELQDEWVINSVQGSQVKELRRPEWTVGNGQ